MRQTVTCFNQRTRFIPIDPATFRIEMLPAYVFSVADFPMLVDFIDISFDIDPFGRKQRTEI